MYQRDLLIAYTSSANAKIADDNKTGGYTALYPGLKDGNIVLRIETDSNQASLLVYIDDPYIDHARLWADAVYPSRMSYYKLADIPGVQEALKEEGLTGTKLGQSGGKRCIDHLPKVLSVLSKLGYNIKPLMRMPVPCKPKAGKKRRYKPGTYTRKYNGKNYTLVVEADGTCRCGGKKYLSPTAATEAITEQKNINGRKFFGIKPLSGQAKF